MLGVRRRDDQRSNARRGACSATSPGRWAWTDTRFGVTDVSAARGALRQRQAGEPARMGDTAQGLNPDGTPGTDLHAEPHLQSAGAAVGRRRHGGERRRLHEVARDVRNGGGAILKPETVAAALQNQIGNLPRREPKMPASASASSARVLDDPAAAKSPGPRGTRRLGRRLWPQLVHRSGQRDLRRLDEQHRARGLQRALPRRDPRRGLRERRR